MKNIKKICLLILMVFIPIFSHALENGCRYSLSAFTNATIEYSTEKGLNITVSDANNGDVTGSYVFSVTRSDFFDISNPTTNCEKKFVCPNLSEHNIFDTYSEYKVSSDGTIKGTRFNSNDVCETTNNQSGKSGDEKIITPESCDSLFGDPSEKGTPAYYLLFAFKIIRYVAIIILIAYTIVDFISATASQDADAIKKVSKNALRRLIICIIIFVLPTIITYVLQLVYDNATSLCIEGGTI